MLRSKQLIRFSIPKSLCLQRCTRDIVSSSRLMHFLLVGYASRIGLFFLNVSKCTIDSSRSDQVRPEKRCSSQIHREYSLEHEWYSKVYWIRFIYDNDRHNLLIATEFIVNGFRRRQTECMKHNETFTMIFCESIVRQLTQKVLESKRDLHEKYSHSILKTHLFALDLA